MALYAANFGGDNADDKTVGTIQHVSNLGSTNNAYAYGIDNNPHGWTGRYWTAAPTPSGHAGFDLTGGDIGDYQNSFYFYGYAFVSAVL